MCMSDSPSEKFRGRGHGERARPPFGAALLPGRGRTGDRERPVLPRLLRRLTCPWSCGGVHEDQDVPSLRQEV